MAKVVFNRGEAASTVGTGAEKGGVTIGVIAMG